MTFQHFLDKLKSSCVEASLASWNAVKIGDGDKSCETNRALRGLREQRDWEIEPNRFCLVCVMGDRNLWIKGCYGRIFIFKCLKRGKTSCSHHGSNDDAPPIKMRSVHLLQKCTSRQQSHAEVRSTRRHQWSGQVLVIKQWRQFFRVRIGDMHKWPPHRMGGVPKK